MPALLSLLSRSLPAVLCSAALLANAAAQDCGAALGSPAPAVDVERWVRASLRAPQDAPRLRVVHFWSAQSDACRRWLPLLTELQLDYGAQGLEVTSVASDGHGSPDAGAAALNATVRTDCDRIGIAVGWDPDGSTFERWTGHALGSPAAPRPPLAFVVDERQRVVYAGHPMWLRAPIEGVLRRTWEPERGRERMREAAREWELLYRASVQRPDVVLARTGAFRERYPSVTHVVDDLEFEALIALDRGAEAAAVARRITARARVRRDAARLNELAWSIVDPHAELTHRDLELALSAATLAVAIQDGGDAFTLDTLARTHAWRGDLERALWLQERAVALEPHPILEQALAEYRRELGDARRR